VIRTEGNALWSQQLLDLAGAQAAGSGSAPGAGGPENLVGLAARATLKQLDRLAAAFLKASWIFNTAARRQAEAKDVETDPSSFLVAETSYVVKLLGYWTPIINALSAPNISIALAASGQAKLTEAFSSNISTTLHLAANLTEMLQNASLNLANFSNRTVHARIALIKHAQVTLRGHLRTALAFQASLERSFACLIGQATKKTAEAVKTLHMSEALSAGKATNWLLHEAEAVSEKLGGALHVSVRGLYNATVAFALGPYSSAPELVLSTELTHLDE
jgi:hypothetical protein